MCNTHTHTRKHKAYKKHGEQRRGNSSSNNNSNNSNKLMNLWTVQTLPWHLQAANNNREDWGASTAGGRGGAGIDSWTNWQTDSGAAHQWAGNKSQHTHPAQQGARETTPTTPESSRVESGQRTLANCRPQSAGESSLWLWLFRFCKINLPKTEQQAVCVCACVCVSASML